jgi:hypothetical protein
MMCVFYEMKLYEHISPKNKSLEKTKKLDQKN